MKPKVLILKISNKIEDSDRLVARIEQDYWRIKPEQLEDVYLVVVLAKGHWIRTYEMNGDVRYNVDMKKTRISLKRTWENDQYSEYFDLAIDYPVKQNASVMTIDKLSEILNDAIDKKEKNTENKTSGSDEYKDVDILDSSTFSKSSDYNSESDLMDVPDIDIAGIKKAKDDFVGENLLSEDDDDSDGIDGIDGIF